MKKFATFVFASIIASTAAVSMAATYPYNNPSNNTHHYRVSDRQHNNWQRHESGRPLHDQRQFQRMEHNRWERQRYDAQHHVGNRWNENRWNHADQFRRGEHLGYGHVNNQNRWQRDHRWEQTRVGSYHNNGQWGHRSHVSYGDH